MENIIYGKLAEDGFRGDDGKTYPISANYVSKSRLLIGDTLKLTLDDRGISYKQIELVPRRTVIAIVQVSADSEKYYAVTISGEAYEIPFASASFYKLRNGDEVVVIIPRRKEDSGGMCAIDGAIKNSKNSYV